MDSLQAIELINQVVEDINSKTLLLTNMLSDYDLQEQDILHYIENKKLNAVKTSQVFKILRDIRTKRRETKDELNRYRSMQTKIASGTVLTSGIKIKQEPTFYEVRTNVLFDVSGYTAGSKMYFGDIPAVSANELKETVVNDSQPLPETTEKKQVDEVVSQDSSDSEMDIESIFSYPEGRKLILTHIQTGTVNIVANFEAAVRRAIGSRFGSIKPLELVKNISGIMRAIKFGSEYLGYRWEVQNAQN